jgi:hypothetical protein
MVIFHSFPMKNGVFCKPSPEAKRIHSSAQNCRDFRSRARRWAMALLLSNIRRAWHYKFWQRWREFFKGKDVNSNKRIGNL